MTSSGEFQAAAIVSWAEAAARTSPPLRVTGVVKSFGGGFDPTRALPWRRNAKREVPRRVVDDVSFEIRRGEIFGVIGANGSGKSTLIRMISTLLIPDGGDVQVFGLDAVRDAMGVRSLINRVSADPSFFRTMTALENLLFFGRVYGLTPREIKRRVPEILERLGLEPERLGALAVQTSWCPWRR